MAARDQAVLAGVAAAMKQEIEKIAAAFEVHRDKRLALEARVEALEKGGNLADCYRGTWSEGEHYKRGELATDGGSLWLCLSSTAERPSKSPTCWRLISKGGGR